MPTAEEENLNQKLERYERALELFVDRLKEDRWILGAVLVGSLSRETIWRRESMSVWIIEADGVTRRRKSDGGEERIFRTYVEEGININAELIPRTRFKLMIEGSSRTAFTHSFFAERRLLFASDESIGRWFDDANRLATRDQETALLVAATWVVHPLKHIRLLLTVKKDRELARQELLGVAWSLAAIQIILQGEVYEEEIIYRAMEYAPELFETTYSALLKGTPTRRKLDDALAALEAYLDANWSDLFKPVLRYLRKRKTLTPLSEIGDEFAHTQIYPWHLKTACEWLADRGVLERMSAPITLTAKSHVEIEEPAYEILD